MREIDQPALEQKLRDHGVSPRRLYPPWFRILRTVGLLTTPPIFLSYPLHVLYLGALTVVIVAIAASILWAIGWAPRMQTLLGLWVLVVINPTISWLSCYLMRRRIGVTLERGQLTFRTPPDRCP